MQFLLSKYAIERWFNFPLTCLVYMPYMGNFNTCRLYQLFRKRIYGIIFTGQQSVQLKGTPSNDPKRKITQRPHPFLTHWLLWECTSICEYCHSQNAQSSSSGKNSHKTLSQVLRLAKSCTCESRVLRGWDRLRGRGWSPHWRSEAWPSPGGGLGGEAPKHNRDAACRSRNSFASQFVSAELPTVLAWKVMQSTLFVCPFVSI